MKHRVSAAALAVLLTSPVFAQAFGSMSDYDLLDSYVAFIGSDDLVNSSGDRLTEAWQIIRQDRANYHRFGVRDSRDQADRFFDSIENRARLEEMLRRGDIDSRTAREVEAGDVLILVEVYDAGSRGNVVRVTTSN